MRVDSESEEEERIAALHATGLLDSPPNPAADELIAGLAEHYGANTAWVSLVDQRQVRFLSTYGFDYKSEDYQENHAPWLNEALFGRKLPIIIGDCRRHTAFENSPYVLSGEVVFMAFVQLATKKGHVIGAVGIDDPEPRYGFTLQDADHLVSSARELASILGI